MLEFAVVLKSVWQIQLRMVGAESIVAALSVAIWLSLNASAADLTEADTLYKSGKYDQCARLASEAIADRELSETWPLLKIQAEMALGRYPEALQTLENSLKRFESSVRLRWVGRHVYLHNGQSNEADEAIRAIDRLIQRSRWRYRDPANFVTVGRHFLLRGVDPKSVLDEIYGQIKSRHPEFVDVYVASGDLALEKHDYQLAAEEYQNALKLDKADAGIYYGLARAYAPSDPTRAEKMLQTALARNPNHIDSLLFIADQHVDAERYADAEHVLDRIGKVNERHPLLWAYRAVLAHLENDASTEAGYRQNALKWWPSNPEVDHVIGRKLSQKYRFAEGSEYQKRSLKLDPDYLPAQIQLSQDLLRLGREEEGWRLASKVNERDGYNVVAHNLVTLHDHLMGFQTLEGQGFVIRMDVHEAEIYGQQVLELLTRAKQRLCAKYEVDIDQPVLVELFPRQQDFAIRTFGLPGGAGFLGVCFGHVITANSPASQGEIPANWRATLWHEFCHVVTLQKTKNKMPRWLSEGISVYEETQADASWGQSMTPQYREMILDGQLATVSQLSGAFLDPPSPVHLQFAYFESALVVEYLVEQYGMDVLKRVLLDLSSGIPINESLGRRVGSLEALDDEFAEYALQRAEQLGPDVDWQTPELPPETNSKILSEWNQENPNNYWGLQRYARQLLAEKNWQAAKGPLEQLLKLCPEHVGPESAYLLLASVHRELGETEEEQAVLEQLAVRDNDAVDAYVRLMQLHRTSQQWDKVIEAAERMLAVNPLQRLPHEYIAEAADHTGDDQLAIKTDRSLLMLDPIDPAEVHYRLAKRLHRVGDHVTARRHVLKSLEEAPRFLEAHRLLLEIVRQLDRQSGSSAAPSDVESGNERPNVAPGSEPAATTEVN